MFKKYSFLRWFLYFLVFGIWSLWLVQQKVADYDRYIVGDCFRDISSQRPAVLVLGASLQTDSSPSPLFAQRLENGAKLYQAGLVRKILVSGTINKLGQDEAQIGKDYLLDLGVAPQDIFVDNFAKNTYASIFRAKKMFALDSFLISSQDFHLSRSLYIAQRLELDAWGCRADVGLTKIDSSLVRRERLAQIKAWLDLKLGLQLTISGPMINIEEDDRQTWIHNN